MLEAKLDNHIPHCPKCNVILGNIVDCGVIEYNGKRYIQFIRRCNKCNEKVQYCESELGEKETRVVFPNKDIKKIKEDSKDNIKVGEE